MINLKQLLSSGFIFAYFISGAAAQSKLDLNDVSWLWPIPTSDADLSKNLLVSDIKSADAESIWSDDHFQDLLSAVDGGLTEVEGNQVQMGQELRDKSVWMIAGMRVDPCAPGCSATIDGPLGNQKTQIRLIVQPVTTGLLVHDVAVHLIYQWADGANRDDGKFREILSDLDELKLITEGIGQSTSGKPLGIHPGLNTSDPSLNVAVKEFLEKHLSWQHLGSMALMGIQSGIEPWFFLALGKQQDGSFNKIPIPIPAAEPQMIDFRREARVVPAPVVSNRPVGGVATAAVFLSQRQNFLNDLATVGKDSDGNDIVDAELRNRDIPDLIASPLHAHFFNTDCVSCHTETRRRLRLSLETSDFAFKVGGQTPAIAIEQLPKDDWNVRNFGWFTPHSFIGGGPTVATVTQRTANETAEVVEFIERNFRSE